MESAEPSSWPAGPAPKLLPLVAAGRAPPGAAAMGEGDGPIYASPDFVTALVGMNRAVFRWVTFLMREKCTSQ